MEINAHITGTIKIDGETPIQLSRNLHSIKDLEILIQFLKLKSKETVWTLSCLGGYELMKDGTQTVICNSHTEALKLLEEEELFENSYTKEELSALINSFTSDDEVFSWLEKLYEECHNDGGGWGTIGCTNVTGILDTVKSYKFTNL